MPLTALERRIVLLVGAVQFINVLDFMMVMPLGPDFAQALGIPASHIGYVGGSYTAAACGAGLIGALFLDRFDRRKAQIVAMLGLVLATVLGGLAVDMPTLIAARVLAGSFGGPATALSIAIVADAVAPERRGRAMGAVMGSFSLASVLGVPLGLELARFGGWRLPFFAVAALGLVVVLSAFRVLPPQRAHLDAVRRETRAPLARLAAIAVTWPAPLAFAVAALSLMQSFMIIPNIAAYVQFNLGFPRAQIGLLYLVGGAVSFFGMRYAGRLVDRWGAAPVTLATTLALSLVIWLGFVDYRAAIPIIVLFPGFMLFSTARMVAQSTILSKVPAAAERAGFMSLVSAVQHAASAAGAFLSAHLLATAADGRLERVPPTAVTAIGIGLAVPLLMAALERRLPRHPLPAAEPESVAAATTAGTGQPHG